MKIHLQCKWHSPIACKWYSPIASNHTAISSHTKFLEEVQTHTFTQDTIIAYLLHNVEGTVLWAVLTSVWFMWGAWKSQNTIHSYNSHPLSVSVMQAGVTCTSFCNYTAWKWQLEKKNHDLAPELAAYTLTRSFSYASHQCGRDSLTPNCHIYTVLFLQLSLSSCVVRKACNSHPLYTF